MMLKFRNPALTYNFVFNIGNILLLNKTGLKLDQIVRDKRQTKK